MTFRSKDVSDTPALSVVIPTRQRGAVIRRSVDSVLCSPLTDLEVIVVDDGSSDDTAVRLSAIADERFRYHRLESKGNANRARNTGARLSRAPLIAFFDSDDAFGPGRPERLIDFFARRSDVECLVDGYVEFSRGGRHVHRMPDINPGQAELRYMLLAHMVPLTNSAITLRRPTFESIGGYDESMRRHQDRELLLRLAGTHSIWLGDEADVEKYRMTRSISHEFDGYIEGLDALAARVGDYQLPENSQLFRYLTVRSILNSHSPRHTPAAHAEDASVRLPGAMWLIGSTAA